MCNDDVVHLGDKFYYTLAFVKDTQKVKIWLEQRKFPEYKPKIQTAVRCGQVESLKLMKNLKDYFYWMMICTPQNYHIDVLNFLRERIPGLLDGCLTYKFILDSMLNLNRSETLNIFKWVYEGHKNRPSSDISFVECNYDIILFIEQEVQNGVSLFDKNILHPTHDDAKACRYMLQNGYTFIDRLNKSEIEIYYSIEYLPNFA